MPVKAPERPQEAFFFFPGIGVPPIPLKRLYEAFGAFVVSAQKHALYRIALMTAPVLPAGASGWCLCRGLREACPLMSLTSRGPPKP